MKTNEQSFKVIEKTLTDNSTVFNLVLRDDRETIVIHCINWQHAERLARIGNSSTQVNLFSATTLRVNPIFIFESMKKYSLRLSHACNGIDFLKTRPTLNRTHSPSQNEAKISFHQATR